MPPGIPGGAPIGIPPGAPIGIPPRVPIPGRRILEYCICFCIAACRACISAGAFLFANPLPPLQPATPKPVNSATRAVPATLRCVMGWSPVSVPGGKTASPEDKDLFGA
jgi:hypothetical protein